MVSKSFLFLTAVVYVGAFRPPAVPLVAKFPYLSIWSEADNLTDDVTRNGLNDAPQALTGMIKVDNTNALRFMGVTNPDGIPRGLDNALEVNPIQQLSVDVRPRETIYEFSGSGVHLTVTFSTPVFPEDLQTFSLPITYIAFKVRSIDNRPHTVSLYFDTTGEATTLHPDSFVTWDRIDTGGQSDVNLMRIGKSNQAIFQSAEDPVDWGFLYVASLDDGTVSTVIGDSDGLGATQGVRTQFASDGTIPTEDDNRKPRQVNEFSHFPVLATQWKFDIVDTLTSLEDSGVCTAEISACESNASCDHVLVGNRCSIPDDIVDGPDACWQNSGFIVGSNGFNVFTDLVDCVNENPVDTSVTKFVNIGYDDISAIDYYHDIMKPFWTTLFDDANDLMTTTTSQFDDMTQRMKDADDALLQQLEDAGGEQYRTLTSLVYRQAYAATELVFNEQKQKPWLFLKEISSGSFINTVDVIFPMAPILLRDNPALLYLMLEPVLAFANNETFLPYTFEFAPHHLGRWPVCNSGPDQQENMPVEESGNLLLMLAGIAVSANSVDFMEPYLPLLEQWANFLQSETLDPPLQLTTDDFTGESAHDAKLAMKGIIGLGAYGLINKIAGNDDDAQKWTQIAQDFASQWQVLADDGDHFKLTYDAPGSWSLKYNFLWQELLQIDVFPHSIIEEEIEFYLTQERHEFGVPLDSRALFTKGDWYSWIAAVANDQQFDEIFDDIFRFADQTPQRVPITDWYDTITANRQGFQCRPVMGGLYAKILLEEGIPQISLDQFAEARAEKAVEWTVIAVSIIGIIFALGAIAIFTYMSWKRQQKDRRGAAIEFEGLAFPPTELKEESY